MTIIQGIKKSGILVSVILTIFIAACSSHQNPLDKALPQTTAKFLVHASQVAEKQLHVFQAPGGDYYGDCMTGKAKKPLCTALYKAMANYAKTTRAFKNLTVDDLTNWAVFKKHYDDYKNVLFNTL